MIGIRNFIGRAEIFIVPNPSRHETIRGATALLDRFRMAEPVRA
jgi:hypothetical protein